MSNDLNYPSNMFILFEWLKNRKIPVEKRRHPAHQELEEKIQELNDSGDADADALKDAIKGLLNLTGPDQLIIDHDKGDISVIRGATSFGNFEIYCPPLFEDVERYPDVESCGLRIAELMNQ